MSEKIGRPRWRATTQNVRESRRGRQGLSVRGPEAAWPRPVRAGRASRPVRPWPGERRCGRSQRARRHEDSRQPLQAVAARSTVRLVSRGGLLELVDLGGRALVRPRSADRPPPPPPGAGPPPPHVHGGRCVRAVLAALDALVAADIVDDATLLRGDVEGHPALLPGWAAHGGGGSGRSWSMRRRRAAATMCMTIPTRSMTEPRRIAATPMAIPATPPGPRSGGSRSRAVPFRARSTRRRSP